MDITLIVELVLFVLLMLFSGFFSSAETGLFSLNKLQIEQMRSEDNPRIKLIERLLSEPRRLIVTILIGNEFVNVAASVISASIVIQLLGADNKIINLFIMIPILLLVGEITPKTLAIRNNKAFATFQSRPIDMFARLIAPVRWLVRLIAEWFTTLIVGHELERGSIVTRDMVRILAQEAVGDGVLDQDEARYIEQIFNFGNRTVEDLMTPRSNVSFLPADMPLREMVDELKRTRHTKVPIYREHRDAVEGVLHARDLLAVDLAMMGKQPPGALGILREPYFVPETKPAVELFHTFRKRRLSMALAVDEYGGVTGLISMEDLLECIFGDIPSPSDKIAEIDVSIADDGTKRVDGALGIQQFNAEFGATLDEDDFDTVGGRILHEFGELPEEGADIIVGGFSFTVEEVDANRLKTLVVREHDEEGEVVAHESEEPAGGEQT
ncbi:MAG: hemolysin family protein [Gammaproteobacteria bacterium]|nr:hemolysin family protein [Gammaproteobacteria bacterium]